MKSVMKVSSLGFVSIMTALSLSACVKSETPQSAEVQTETKNGEFRYQAMGSEPDWTVTVEPDNMLTFSTPENMDDLKITAQRTAYAKGVEYTGEYQGKAFLLNLKGEQCSDTMSDKVYDMKATFEFDGQIYKGCAASQ